MADPDDLPLAWWHLFNWEWVLSRVAELVGRLFLEEYAPLMSTPSPFDWNDKQNRRNFRTYVEHYEKVEHIVNVLAINGFGIPDAPGRFSLEFCNHQKVLYVLPTETSWVNESYRSMFRDMGYDFCRAPIGIFTLPISWLPFVGELLLPPHNQLGLVLYQMNRLRQLSQLVDLYHPDIFRKLDRD